MEKIREWLKKYGEQSSQFWKDLPVIRKAIVIGVATLLIVGLTAIVATRESEPQKYIFTDLSSQDTAMVLDFFKRNNIQGVSSDGKGVLAPESKMAEYKLMLAKEGLPTSGIVGWETFDSQEFTRTDFEQKIQKQRAMEGELAKTIMLVENIHAAKVHIVIPRSALFQEDQRQPTASVYIKTKRGQELDKKQIKAITHLVSGSVEGLKPKAVTIIDQEGRMLTEVTPDDFASIQTQKRLGYKRNIEKLFEQRVRGIVGRVVGPDRVEVKVDVEVDFTEEKRTESQIDPESSAVVMQDITGYSLEGSGLNPTGVPGAKSNIPGETQGVEATTSRTENTKDSERKNFEYSRTVSQKTLSVGDIMKVSAAVLVDGKQEYPIDGTKPVFEPRTPEEIKTIEELVRHAIGYDEKRGDKVTVQNLMFQLDQLQIETIKEEKQETREYIATLALSAAVALGLVLFFAFVVRPYFRWLSYDPERKRDEQVVEEFRPDLELGTMQNVQVKEDVPFEKLTPQEQVMYLAKNEPKRTTEALRLMLNPHQGA